VRRGMIQLAWRFLMFKNIRSEPRSAPGMRKTISSHWRAVLDFRFVEKEQSINNALW
jgi:hypothetical protein